MRLEYELTQFIGRQEEIEALRALIEQNRLVTVTGPGGSGKTRLSAELLKSFRREFRGGTRFIDLAVIEEPGAVGAEIRSLSGVDELASGPESASKILFCFDNCEHVRPEAAEAVRDLLSTIPSAHALATSREPLGIPGEKLFPLHPLEVPPEKAPAATLDDFDSVRLFVDRVRATDPEFELTEESATLVAAICRELDGLPLAIELIAPYVRSLGLHQTLERVREAGIHLSSRGDPASERQSSLSSAIDWSYRALSAEEQRALAALAVFSGSFNLEAAQGVLPAAGISSERVPALMVSLVDKSLVRVHRQDERTWYRLLELVKAFGHGHLGQDDVNEDAPEDPTLGLYLEKEGELFRIGRGSKSFLLKDSKGLRYLHQLVRSPGVEFPAIALASPGRDVSNTPIEAIDPKARDAYRRRLEDLEEQIREAEEFDDLGRKQSAEDERKALADELARSLGIGGKIRGQGSDNEKARLSVTRAIRSAIDRIEAQDPALGRRLGRDVRTGNFCGYFPLDE